MPKDSNRDRLNNKFDNKVMTTAKRGKKERGENHKNEAIDNIIEIPFPPPITVDDLIAKTSPHGNNPGRTPNAFIAYKMGIHRVLRNEKCNYQIPAISRLASDNWAKEPPHVKKYYKKLANEAKEKYERSRPIFISMDKKFVEKDSPTPKISKPSPSTFSENSLSPSLSPFPSPSLSNQSQQSDLKSQSISKSRPIPISQSESNYNNFSDSLFFVPNATAFDSLITPQPTSSSCSSFSFSPSSSMSSMTCSNPSEILDMTCHPSSSASSLYNQDIFIPEDPEEGYPYEEFLSTTNANLFLWKNNELPNDNSYSAFLEKRVERLEQICQFYQQMFLNPTHINIFDYAALP